MNYGHLKLKILPGSFKYVLLSDRKELVEILGKAGDEPVALFSAIDEISAIIPSSIEVSSKKVEGNWTCIRVVGEMPFGSVQGLIATIGTSLKQKKLGMCVVSTFLTDWFFVKTSSLTSVVEALKQENWEFDA